MVSLAPLSQFFNALYLKPLDDALSRLDILYVRFQDDILAFCKSKRQLNRCRKRMMEILNERQLKLSRKKSRMGTVTDSFHFLGIHYSLTQPENYISVKQANDDAISDNSSCSIFNRAVGGVDTFEHQQHVALRITPHPQTQRKARENVKLMGADQVSPAKITRYFVQWARWWVKTANTWDFQTLVEQFINTCWQPETANIAADVLSRYFTELNTSSDDCRATLAA